MKSPACIIAAAFMFSSVAFADVQDQRTEVQLTSQQRSLVISEMQQFLSGLQQISEALSRDEMQTVARVSRSLGLSMSKHMPAELKQALPQGFRKIGHSVHAGFDQIALDAEVLGDSSHTLSQLGETLAGCVSCHNSYQIRTK